MTLSAKKLHGSVPMGFVLLWILLGVTFAHAASRGPLIPSKVFINDDFSRIDLEPNKIVRVFPATRVTCPAKHTKGCTIKLETFLELFDVPTNGTVLEWVHMDEQLISILSLEPPGPVGFQHITSAFVLGDIQAGSTVTVDVQLQNVFDTAQVRERIETIHLLLN